jgi:hypothetical protein
MMKNTKRTIVLTLLLCAGFGAALLYSQTKVWSGEREPVVPFTAYETHFTQVAGVIQPQTTHHSFFAIRSDGSEVHGFYVERTGEKPTLDRTIYDFGQQQIVKVIEAIETKITLPLPGGTVRILVARRTGCTQQFGEHQTLLGQDTVRVNGSLANGGTHDDWMAVALNCYEMSGTITSGTATGVMVVDKLISGEPDSALFEVPSGYVERSHVEAMQEYNRRYGYQPVSNAMAEQLDKNGKYQKP